MTKTMDSGEPDVVVIKKRPKTMTKEKSMCPLIDISLLKTTF
jgi:hypothetical protein